MAAEYLINNVKILVYDNRRDKTAGYFFGEHHIVLADEILAYENLFTKRIETINDFIDMIEHCDNLPSIEVGSTWN